MSTSEASTNPIREMIDSEVVTDSRVWDVDRGTKVSAKASGALKFYYNIDPEAEYGVETAPRAAPKLVIVSEYKPSEDVGVLIVQGDMKFHHQRSPEQPPDHFLEGEADESDEDEAEMSRGLFEDSEEKIATLGLAKKTAVSEWELVSVLESYVPAGPAKK